MALLGPIINKSDRTNGANYRGIALMDVVYTILATLLNNEMNNKQ